MAASLSTRGGAYHLGQNADINVTPFVDVMLVLLIIFMVALPAATVSVKLDLPKSQASADHLLPPIVVSLTLGGVVYVGERATTLENLPNVLAASAGPHPTEQRIYLRADEGVRYGALMAVMNRMQGSGYTKVALVNEAA